MASQLLFLRQVNRDYDVIVRTLISGGAAAGAGKRKYETNYTNDLGDHRRQSRCPSIRRVNEHG